MAPRSETTERVATAASNELPPTSRTARLRTGIRATLPAWVLAHVLVISLAVSMSPQQWYRPLFSWDGNLYALMARRMAAGQPAYYTTGNLIHFFPLTPICAAVLSFVTRLPVEFTLIVTCWIAALIFGGLVHVLALGETGDRNAASRAAWLSQLAPGAFVLTMDYTEPIAGVLAVLYFLAVRRGKTGWAVAAGLLAGISRPTGVLLCLVGLIEGLRMARDAGWSRATIGRALAQTLAPALSLAGFLAYSGIYYHGWLLPFSQQVHTGAREALMNNPIRSFEVVSHVPLGWLIAALSAVLIASAIALLVVVARRLPVSYLYWSGLSVILAICAPTFSSLPRYLAETFPLLIAAALVARRRREWWPLVAASSALLLLTAYLAFHGNMIA